MSSTTPTTSASSVTVPNFTIAIRHALAVQLAGLLILGLSYIAATAGTLTTTSTTGLAGLGAGALLAGTTAMLTYARGHQDAIEAAIEDLFDHTNDAVAAASGHADAAQTSAAVATSNASKATDAAQQATSAAADALAAAAAARIGQTTITLTPPPNATIGIPTPSTTGEAGLAAGSTTTTSLAGATTAPSDTGQPASSTDGQSGEVSIGITTG